MKNFITLMILAFMVTATFTSCKKDGDTSLSKNLVVTILPDNSKPLSTKDCVECHDSYPTCLDDMFGKVNIEVFDEIAGSKIIDKNYSIEKPINLGELNPGTYEIRATYYYDYIDTTYIPANPWGPESYFYYYCHGILRHGAYQNWGTNFQILEGQGKKLTISTWTN